MSADDKEKLDGIAIGAEVNVQSDWNETDSESDAYIKNKPSNNVTGSGTSGRIAKWNGTNTITNGPAFGTSTTTYLRNDGTWEVPPGSNSIISQHPNTATTYYPIWTTSSGSSKPLNVNDGFKYYTL
jgi:hypothetical protein